MLEIIFGILVFTPIVMAFIGILGLNKMYSDSLRNWKEAMKDDDSDEEDIDWVEVNARFKRMEQKRVKKNREPSQTV